MSEQGNMERLAIASVATLAAIGAVGCGAGVESSSSSTTGPHGTGTGTEVPTTVFQFDGTVTDGSDAAITAENDLGLYDCGNPKGETWKNADGTDKPFNPDHKISHMNAHPELAVSDSNLWSGDQGIFGNKPFDFLAEKGVGNKEHDPAKTVTAPGVSPNYSKFMEKQNAATINFTAVSENFACKDANGVYHEFPVGAKQLEAGKTHLTGIALTKADYDAFVQLMQDEGKDLSKVFVQEFNVDTNGDGKADSPFVMVYTNAEMCGNPELRIVSAPPGKPPMTITIPRGSTTVPRHTTSTPPTQTTLANKDPNQDYNNPNAPVTSPNKGPGSGGSPGPEGVTSTTEKPPTTGTTVKPGGGPTTVKPVPTTVTPTTIAG